MTGFLCKWLISRRHDDGRPLPAWLERRIERSSDLRAFCAQLEDIERGLSPLGAARRAVPPAIHPFPRSTSRTRLARPSATLWPLAAAATLGFAAGALLWVAPWRAGPQPTIATSPGPDAPTETILAAEPAAGTRLAAALLDPAQRAATIQAVSDRVVGRAETAMQREFDALRADTRRAAQAVLRNFPAPTVIRAFGG